MRPNWPQIRVIYNADQFWSFAYQWRTRVPLELRPYLQGPWMRENILTGHGPLMAKYYTWGDQRQIPGDSSDHTQGLNTNPAMLNDFISEGDTPAYLHLMDTGLRNLDNPTWGGWGGRFTVNPTNPYRVEDLPNTRDFNPYAATTTTTRRCRPRRARRRSTSRASPRPGRLPGLTVTGATARRARCRVRRHGAEASDHAVRAGRGGRDEHQGAVHQRLRGRAEDPAQHRRGAGDADGHRGRHGGRRDGVEGAHAVGATV